MGISVGGCDFHFVKFDSNSCEEKERKAENGDEGGEPTRKKRQSCFRLWKLTDADVVVDGLSFGPEHVGELSDRAEADDPLNEKDVPEVVVDRSRIFQPENEEVLDDHDAVHGEERRNHCNVFQKYLKVAVPRR